MKKIRKYIYQRVNKYGRMQYYFADVPLSEEKLKSIPNRMWVSRDKLGYYAKYNNYSLKGLPDPELERLNKKYGIDL